MKLNVKRFASSGEDELYPNYSYDYTPNGYIRTATVTIVCEYDISSVFLVQGGDEINDTENWIITEDFYGRPCIKRYFHEPIDATYNIYCENNETPFSVNVYIANDFQPESEQYSLEINGDIKIAKTTMKLKDVVNSIHNIADIIYPIGSIYISATATNPGTVFGGTWIQLKNHFLFATNATSGSKGQDAVSTGAGTSTGSTVLSANQLPKITGDANCNIVGHQAQNMSSGVMSWAYAGKSGSLASGNTMPYGHVRISFGNNEGHTHTIPYIEVYVWQRTA